MNPPKNVLMWLDNIRARPSMYIRDKSLQHLQSLLWGYYAALATYGLVEDVPSMDRHFNTWLYYTRKWSTCAGWAHSIDERYPAVDDALDAFFKLVDEYRQLAPTRLWTVRLGPRHNPTGNRVTIGFEGRMEKPQSIEITQYRPTRLHFLRFHYENRIVDDDLLMKGSGSHATSLEYAKTWVRDEFQVELDSWERCIGDSRAEK